MQETSSPCLSHTHCLIWLHLLGHKSRKYRKRYGSSDRRGQIRNRVSIDERPAIVDQRSRIGDFVINTVIGKNHKQALVTIVDRYSKLTLIKKVTHKRAGMCHLRCHRTALAYFALGAHRYR